MTWQADSEVLRWLVGHGGRPVVPREALEAAVAARDREILAAIERLRENWRMNGQAAVDQFTDQVVARIETL